MPAVTPVFKIFFVIMGLMLLPSLVIAAPDAVLIEKWTAHNPASTARVDHDPLDRLLAKYRSMGTDQIARFAYDKISATDKARLDDYLNQLSQTAVSTLSKKSQYAFWVNLYNSLTLKVILDHYPQSSIRNINISPGLFTSGPWGAALIMVEGSALSLDNIEHGIIRPIWRDPRSHYVLNCASLGCPDLPAAALRPHTLDQTLSAAAVAFINHPRAVQVTNGTLVVSSIYRWFSDDFGSSDHKIIAHLTKYAAPGLKAALGATRRIDDDFYDWQLNQ